MQLDWYIFRALGGADPVLLAREAAALPGCESYVPTFTRRQDYLADGERLAVEQVYPALPGSLFVRAGAAGIARLSAAFAGRALLCRNADGRPCAVAGDTVVLIKYALHCGGGEVRFLPALDSRLFRGEPARIAAGPLEGVTGYVKRIRKDRKFLVPIGSYSLLMLPRSLWNPVCTPLV